MNNQNNNLPEGFKMTESAPLLEEWRTAKLSSLLKERAVKNHEHEQLPVYTISNIYGFILSDDFFEKQVYSRDLGTYKVIDRGFFAYNPYRVNVGSIGIFQHKGRGLVSPAYVVFEIEKPEILDCSYLFLLLKSDRYHELIKKYSMSRGSVRRSLSYKDLIEFEIPIPPLPEQKAIAGVLSTIQKAIETQDKIIAAARELKKSLMHHLFTYGPVPVAEAEKVPLKETEIGPVPEHWEVVRLGDLSESVRYGTSVLSIAGEIGVPVLRIPNVLAGTIDMRDLKFIDLPERVASSYRLESGDLLFVRTNGQRQYVGRCAVFNDELPEALFASYLIRVRLQLGRSLPKFVQAYTMTSNCREYLNGKASYATGGRFNINSQVLKNMLIPFPSHAEQKEIARMLSAVDTKIKAGENHKAALQTLFKTMLHHLMTGKVRVTDMERKVPVSYLKAVSI